MLQNGQNMCHWCGNMWCIGQLQKHNSVELCTLGLRACVVAGCVGGRGYIGNNSPLTHWLQGFSHMHTPYATPSCILTEPWQTHKGLGLIYSKLQLGVIDFQKVDKMAFKKYAKWL